MVYVGRLSDRFSLSVGDGDPVWFTVRTGDALASVLYKASSRAPGDESWSLPCRADDENPSRIGVALVGMRTALEVEPGCPAWLTVHTSADLARALLQAGGSASRAHVAGQ
ncbi:MAG TPA: hypothetical protein VHX38_11600 [Pseudonocardiaceae bacterium]|nr:hypothetical protein [Pseudonocardiaceae bacterium]